MTSACDAGGGGGATAAGGAASPTAASTNSATRAAAEPRRHLRERRRRLGERRPQRLYHARDALPTTILLLADLAEGQGLHQTQVIVCNPGPLPPVIIPGRPACEGGACQLFFNCF